MPRRRPGFINWRSSKAREIIIEDLEPGGILWGRDSLQEVDCWRFYRNLPEFENVLFEQFKDRLKEHRKQANKLKELSHRDLRAFLHDMALHPPTGYDNRGRLMFNAHPAKELLQADVKEGRHTMMPPSQLRLTRPEYLYFDKRVFKERIYQEVRRNKFIHYLELKRRSKRSATTRTYMAFDQR